MREGRVTCTGKNGDHEIAFTDWGDVSNPNILVCAHGLTRNSRDFDKIAESLSEDYRVICPDMVGRGNSDWLSQADEYGYPQYVADTLTLLGQFEIRTLNWLGTSMGGLLGMMLAAMPDTPIQRMVINDIGPFIKRAPLRRIAAYLSARPKFETFEDLESHLREIHAPFGPLTDGEWHHVATHSALQTADNRWQTRYDPDISVPFCKAIDADIDIWEIWDQIRCPVLVLRGADSDLLSGETAAEMTTRGPGSVTVKEFEGVGHAPMLMADDQILCIQRWLSK